MSEVIIFLNARFFLALQRYEVSEHLLVQAVVGDGDGAFCFVLEAIMYVYVCASEFVVKPEIMMLSLIHI